MNILFLTLLSFDSIQERTIYTDLLREFVNNGHQVYAISPIEKRQKQGTHIVREESATILRLQIGNTQKTNTIEKGISTLMMGPLFKRSIKKHFSAIRFDLVIYSTPPITLASAIKYIKKRDNAKTYLLLKDIFPQNAVDIGLMNKKGILYKYFRREEKKLYSISDRIGCMSQANVDYLRNNNPEIDSGIVEICPNSIDALDKSVDQNTRRQIRRKYNIPWDKTVFVYGGNLGKPQGIPFLLDCIKICSDIEEVFFLIVGDGTEYGLVNEYIKDSRQKNVMSMKRLPKEEYDTLVGACDVGMVFLDHRFTVPNFPSRILSYMQAKIPVVACTDPNTDIGKTIVEGDFGWWCESKSPQEFRKIVRDSTRQDLADMGERGFIILRSNYSVKKAYKTIMSFS